MTKYALSFSYEGLMELIIFAPRVNTKNTWSLPVH